jgi:thiol:disulfide interchange protein
LFPPSDAAKDIATALSLARKDGKRVLLDFGADWCIDCRVLEPLIKEPEVAKFLAANFHLVRVDLGYYKGRDGMQKNDDIAKQYGVGTAAVGIPAIVLLDQHGRIVPPPKMVVWRMARLFTAPEVLNFLKELAAAR